MKRSLKIVLSTLLVSNAAFASYDGTYDLNFGEGDCPGKVRVEISPAGPEFPRGVVGIKTITGDVAEREFTGAIDHSKFSFPTPRLRLQKAARITDQGELVIGKETYAKNIFGSWRFREVLNLRIASQGELLSNVDAALLLFRKKANGRSSTCYYRMHSN